MFQKEILSQLEGMQFFLKINAVFHTTLRRSAVIHLKDTFTPSNIDFLNPQKISFPMVYNTNSPFFDTNLTQIPWTTSMLLDFSTFFLNYLLVSNVSFGTTLSRELLPLKTPHTRAGDEMRLRGVANLGPGSYRNDEVDFSIIIKRKILVTVPYFTIIINLI